MLTALLLGACSEPAPTVAGLALPGIAQALSETCPDAPPPEPMPQGSDHHRVTLDASEARCNDGTPPVVYIRGATDPALQDVFVVRLAGGGACASASECAERWCGTGQGPYDASHMSSRWHPETARGIGIGSMDASNALAGAHHVFAQYCSSDQWLGRRGVVNFAVHEPPFSLVLSGGDIVDALIDALEVGMSSDDGIETLPSWSQAEMVLLGGSSAGGFGAAHAWSTVVAAVPQATVVLVADAAFIPALAVLTDSAAQRLVDVAKFHYEHVAIPLWNTQVDTSCALAYPESPERCLEIDPLLRVHHERTVLVVHDLADPVLYALVEEAGLTLSEFVDASAATLSLWADELPAVSVFGPFCGVHTTLTSDARYAGTRLSNAEGALSIEEAVEAVRRGGRVVRIADPRVPTETCGSR